MRKAAKFLAVGAMLMFGGLTARADMVISANQLAGTGFLAGWDVYQVYVTNNGVNGTGDNVVGWDITVANPIGVPLGTPALSPQPLWFYRTGTNGVNVDPKGSAMASNGVLDETGTSSGSITTSNRGTGSFISLVGQDTGTGGTGVFYDQSVAIYPPGTGNAPSPFTNSNFATIKSFRVTGSYTMSVANGNPNDRLKGTVRLGNVIVPQGAGFTLTGKILPYEGDNGQPAKFGVNAAFGNVPEPASLGLVGLGMLALGRRRRQA